MVYKWTLKDGPWLPRNKDDDHLDRLRDRLRREPAHPPSMQRIAELMQSASKTASRKLLERLAAAGFVQRTPDDDAWTSPALERPLAGGDGMRAYPDLIEGVGADPFLIDDYLVRNPSRTVMIPVRGDSMLEAGIHDGDIVAVERTTEVGRATPLGHRGGGQRIHSQGTCRRERAERAPAAQPRVSGDPAGGATGNLRRDGRAGAAQR